MEKLFTSLGIITFGITLGYVIQQLERRGTIRVPLGMLEMRKLLVKIGILGFISFSFFLAIWNLRIPDMRLMAIPFIGLGTLVLGGLVGILSGKAMRLPGRKTGALFGCCSFTNIGAIGALICIVFIGEEAFALVALYKLFEETYYVIAFPIAKYYSASEEVETLPDRLKRVFTDVFVVTILSAVGMGTLLNFSGIARPPVFATINAIIVPLGTVTVLTSIGMALRFSNVRAYIKECLTTMSVKFLIAPIAATSVAYLLGFHTIMDGLPLKVVLVCSSMPVAFNALIPPTLYDLDLDLANSCWLASMVSLFVTLPVLYFLLQML
ncbi:hypothetical protein OAN24_03410 [Pseudodesulfovibrio sp.]|nr:hypothetical protein [Pseudodesulfovibrio sp.]